MRFTSVYKPRARAGRDDPWLIAVSLPGGRKYVTGTRSRGDGAVAAKAVSGLADVIGKHGVNSLTIETGKKSVTIDAAAAKKIKAAAKA